MGEAAAKEPTMEDILSSIRKIIAEEDGGQGAPAAETASAPAVDPVVAEPEPVAIELDPAPAAPEPVASYEEPEPVSAEAPAEVEPPVFETAEPVATDATDAGMGALAQLASEIQSSIDSPAAPDEAVGQEAEPMMDEPVAIIQDTPAPEMAVAEEAASEMTNEPVIEPETSQIVSRSLADIAAAAKEADMAAQAPEAPMPVENPVEPDAIHVEMAEAEPAPAPVVETPPAPAAIYETPAAPAAEVSDASFKGALMSPSADAAASGAFDRLKRSVMDDLEAQTEAVLRPMLREWLDENLPNLVERLVREEIERVARG